MDLGLAGQTAVVTGGSKGIGLAVVRGLAGHGVRVVTGARSSSAELDELTRTGPVQALQVDLAEPSGAGRLAAQAGDRIDILVNNAGGAPAGRAGSSSITDEDWLATITLDLMAAVRMTRSVLPAMLAAGSGAIITICSVNARLPDPAVLDYCVAKAWPGQLLQGPVQGSRAAGDPGEYRQPRSRRHRLVAGSRRSRADVRSCHRRPG